MVLNTNTLKLLLYILPNPGKHRPDTSGKSSGGDFDRQRLVVPAILKYNLENKPITWLTTYFCQSWNLETYLFLYNMRGLLTWLAPKVKEDDHNYAALLATSDHVAQLPK